MITDSFHLIVHRHVRHNFLLHMENKINFGWLYLVAENS